LRTESLAAATRERLPGLAARASSGEF